MLSDLDGQDPQTQLAQNRLTRPPLNPIQVHPKAFQRNHCANESAEFTPTLSWTLTM